VPGQISPLLKSIFKYVEALPLRKQEIVIKYLPCVGMIREATVYFEAD
jgi:hypothetical protein